MNGCRDCTFDKFCPWWCAHCLLHHPVVSMVKHCLSKADADERLDVGEQRTA